MNLVLDASAVVAFLTDEPGAEVVEALLLDPDNIAHIHVINLCEVFYHFHRSGGEAAAQEAVASVYGAEVAPRSDFDAEFWQGAARLKSALRRVSLADCLAISLSQRLGAELITSDHHEFDVLVPLGLCPIRFIR